MEYDNFKLQCVPKSLALTCKKTGQADRARIKGHPVFVCIFSGEELDHHLPAADGDHGSLLGGGESRETLSFLPSLIFTFLPYHPSIYNNVMKKELLGAWK